MKYQTENITIPSDTHTYPVHIGADILKSIGPLLQKNTTSRSISIVCDSHINNTFGNCVYDSLVGSGFDVHRCTIDAGEDNKTLGTAHTLYRTFLDQKLDRTSTIIAIGGGVVGDVAGFASATFMRGLSFVNIPTTLLAMVDAAVGGKTGVNLDSNSGQVYKNLVGSFHQPNLVLMDVTTLNTLSDRHIRSGLAECVKHGILGEPEILKSIQQNGATFTKWGEKKRIKFLYKNIKFKAKVVKNDPSEKGLRMCLNLGHTFAHAIETRPELNLWHGEAVALGLIAAAHTGVALHMTKRDLPDQIRTILTQIGLPTSLGQLPNCDTLIQTMTSDKKATSGNIRLVIPLLLGTWEIAENVPHDAICAGWDAITQ